MSWILLLVHLTIIEIAPFVGTQIISIETRLNKMRMGQLTQDTMIKKASRRSYMIRCCGSESCRGPDSPRRIFARTTTTTRNPLAAFQYQRQKSRGRPVAVAEFSDDGFTISCPDCPLYWQEMLSFVPAPPGAIPLICPFCPTEWRDLLQIKPQMTTARAKQKKTTKSSDEDTTDTDSTDTDSSSDKAENLVVATKPVAAKVTTTTAVKITTTLAPTTTIITVTSTTTTIAAATTAGGGGGLLGGLLGNVLGGGGNKPKVTKPPTTQPSFDNYGFKLD